ncbi:MAG: APC family permease [Halobacteriota archaeon]
MASEGKKGGIGTWGAAFLGVGSMVGAGIFALLGEAGAVAGAAVWASFAFGGLIAGLLGYVIARLGVRYPSSGGLMAYLSEGFGARRIPGIAAWMYYFAGIIITAMVAVAFGNYGAAIIFGESAPLIWTKILATAMVIVITVVVIIGAEAVIKLQSIIAIVVIAIFAIFIVATVSQLNTTFLSPSDYPPVRSIASAAALTFFAYLGFAVISFATGDMKDPARTLPRAMYLAIGIATGIYVLVSLGVFGSLPVNDVIAHGSIALAVAAIPVLGPAGFLMMAIAALISTTACTNSGLYAAGNVTRDMAMRGEFPSFFGGRSRVGGPRGLVITSVIVLLMLNLLNLTAIASLGSAVALIIFLIICAAAFVLRKETGTRTWILVLTAALTAIVLVLFIIDLIGSEPATVVFIVITIALAVVLDAAWRRVKKRRQQAEISASAG